MSDEPKVDIQDLFGLSYAQYFAVSRTALQSMPTEWQERFVECIEELSELIDWAPKDGNYSVTVRTKNGKFGKDPLADYEHGRRRLELKKPVKLILTMEEAAEISYAAQVYWTDAPERLDFKATVQVVPPPGFASREAWRFIATYTPSQLHHYEESGFTVVDVCPRCILDTCQVHG